MKLRGFQPSWRGSRNSSQLIAKAAEASLELPPELATHTCSTGMSDVQKSPKVTSILLHYSTLWQRGTPEKCFRVLQYWLRFSFSSMTRSPQFTSWAHFPTSALCCLAVISKIIFSSIGSNGGSGVGMLLDEALHAFSVKGNTLPYQ